LLSVSVLAAGVVVDGGVEVMGGDFSSSWFCVTSVSDLV
jgi:hypothetical protein